MMGIDIAAFPPLSVDSCKVDDREKAVGAMAHGRLDLQELTVLERSNRKSPLQKEVAISITGFTGSKDLR